MTEKNLLISSMEKLITYLFTNPSHVRKSRINQEEIFYSLSRNDFKKILSNLEDDNPMLRKTSLNLIAQLMSQNSKLKKKFCKTMDINLIPGKILFNSKTIEKHASGNNLRILLPLLKKQPDQVQIDSLLWFINLNNKKSQLQLQYVQKDKNKFQMQIDIDPQQCIVGFFLTPNDLSSEFSTTSLSMCATEISQQQKKIQLKNLIQQNPRKIISVVGSKVNSSMSDSQPKYQRNNKNAPLQTDRPRKFINNFVHQRKLNSSKGNQTERYTTLNAQNINYVPSRQSFESIQIQRSTMPKTTQSPYIPSLNLQNNSGYKSDRISQIPYTSTNNRSKEMDFQKIKYQGIKITASSNNRTSYGGNVQRTNTDRINNNDRTNPSNRVNTDRSMTDNGFLSTSFNNNSQHLNNSSQSFNHNNGQTFSNNSQNFKREGPDNSFNFKYIKPVSSVHNEGVKFVNFFHKRQEQPVHFAQKKTIDVFQYIKNR